MAIKGINLSPIREQQWRQKSYRNIALLVVNFIISCSLFGWILLSSIDLEKIYQQNQTTLNKIISQLEQNTQQILVLKNNNQIKPIYLKKQKISEFIHYLTTFSIQGIIETTQLYIDKEPKIKINGKLLNQTDFEQITQQIKQYHYPYKIENFQNTEDNRYEFSIIINLERNKDEKLDTQ